MRKFPFEGAPLARDTEILTQSGWRRIDAIRIGENVLTRRDTDGVLEWHPVQALPQRYADTLYHFKSRSIDLLVTEEHVMVCEHQSGGPLKRIPAGRLWNRTGYFLPHHGIWTGENPATLFGHDAGDICEVIGWYLAEGCRVSNMVTICQSATGNPAKCQRIENLFNRLGWRFTKNERAYYISVKSMPVALRDLLWGSGKAKTKRVPALLFQLSPQLIDRLLSGMIAGDGNIFDDFPHGTFPKVNYYTISKGLADDVQILTTLCGLHARVRSRVRVGAGGVMADGRQIQSQNRCYEVTICGAERAKYDRSFKEIVEYNDIAFCVTVKNHAIYARRNGTACWTGNSNFVMPIVATDVDQLFASFMQTIHAPENLWTLEAMNEKWLDAQKPLQDLLQYLDYSQLKMWNVNKRVMLEMTKLGTGIYKTGWLFENRPVWTYNAEGQRVKQQRLISRPICDHVRCADFLIPAYSYHQQPDMQGGAPWIAERLRIQTDRFRSLALAQEPFLPNIDRDSANFILNFVEGTAPEYDSKVQDLDFIKTGMGPTLSFEQNGNPTNDKSGGGRTRKAAEVEIWEIHARFATGGPSMGQDPSRVLAPGQNDSQDDIVVWYHQPTRKIVRAIYNNYWSSPTTPRPYDVVRYFPGEGFWGIGVCEQKEMFQTIGSDLMNYTMDNVLLANARGIAAKAGANIAPGEPNYPGKIWITDGNPRDEFFPFALADIYPSLFNLHELVEVRGEKRVGVGDIQLGSMTNLPGRTPATTMLSLLQEGKKRPDLTMKDLRYEGLSHVGLRLLQLCQQFCSSPQDVGGKRFLKMAMQALGDVPGALAAQKLLMPMEPIEQGLGVHITATSAAANKEVARQNYLSLMELSGQVYPQFIQLAQVAMQAPGTPMAQIAMQSAQGLQELFKRLLEEYDIRNPEKLLPMGDASTGAMDTQAPANAGPAGAGAPAGGGVAPLGPVAPMDALFGAR